MAERNLADVGLIGLAVMGRNLALNMSDHGFKVAVFNRTTRVMKDFVAANPNTPGGLIGCEKLADLVAALKKPRKVVVLVKAGPAVDAVAKQLIEAGVESDDLRSGLKQRGACADPSTPSKGIETKLSMPCDALYCSKICAYAQGFQLMRAAEGEYGWKLERRLHHPGAVLTKIADAYQRDPELGNLLLDPYFQEQIHKNQKRWREAVALAAETGIAAPAFMSALAYYDGYRSAQLPANLLQAQRDYFGAHAYERADEPRGKLFHLDWPKPERREKCLTPG